jgi:hypothetical protein
MKQTILIIFGLLMMVGSFAQKKNSHSKKDAFIDLAGTVGSSRGAAALSYVHNWKLGKKQKWEAGIGARFTSSFGTKQEYTTAPARLARTNTIPFLIVFAGQKTENWDTLTVQRPWANSLNITANFGYNFNSKWSAGFNIDLLGFAFGRKSPAVLTSDGITRTEPAATVSSFNALLTGDLDYGNLNSEFFLKYKLNEKWGIRGVYQFLFNEYKTTTIKQIAPDGTEVNRFRSKANNFGLAVSYQL